jgi:hypothetical protein
VPTKTVPKFLLHPLRNCSANIEMPCNLVTSHRLMEEIKETLTRWAHPHPAGWALILFLEVNPVTFYRAGLSELRQDPTMAVGITSDQPPLAKRIQRGLRMVEGEPGFHCNIGLRGFASSDCREAVHLCT